MTADADVDRVLVEGVESLDEYLSQHEVSCAKLKQGFLKLTKAKLQLPEHALSELSYHEEFEASRVVVLDSDGSWRLQDVSTVTVEKGGKKSGGVRHRRAGASYEDEDVASTVSSKAERSTDTLLWFSSLPPSELRQAQKQFSNGLQAMVLAATSVKTVQEAVQGIMTAT